MSRHPTLNVLAYYKSFHINELIRSIVSIPSIITCPMFMRQKARAPSNAHEECACPGVASRERACSLVVAVT
jgi:hypothetical protein